MHEIRSSNDGVVEYLSVEEGQFIAEDDEVVGILGAGATVYSVITEVPGVVRELHVEPGTAVSEGDLIALIDES